MPRFKKSKSRGRRKSNRSFHVGKNHPRYGSSLMPISPWAHAGHFAGETLKKAAFTAAPILKPIHEAVTTAAAYKPSFANITPDWNKLLRYAPVNIDPYHGLPTPHHSRMEL